jgi:hypothetical protein
VGIVALFFLFTREIARFVQFIVLAVAIAVVFYTTSIVHVLVTAGDCPFVSSSRRSPRPPRPTAP